MAACDTTERRRRGGTYMFLFSSRLKAQSRRLKRIGGNKNPRFTTGFYAFVQSKCKTSALKSAVRQNKNPAHRLIHKALCWCDRRDLNPYPCGHAPQTCAYANSATIANATLILYAQPGGKSTSFSQPPARLGDRHNTKRRPHPKRTTSFSW